MKVRPARIEDAEAIRSVHVNTWAATYRPLVPADVAEQRLRTHRSREGADLIAGEDQGKTGVLVLTVGARVVGFCQYGPTESCEEDPRLVGEILRLYVAPEYQGQGGGKLLLTSAIARLAGAGLTAAVLWVFQADRRARGFYEHLGWRPDGAERHDDSMTDLRYRLRLS